MKKINWDVAKEKVKANLSVVGNAISNSRFLDLGRKLVNIRRNK